MNLLIEDRHNEVLAGEERVPLGVESGEHRLRQARLLGQIQATDRAQKRLEEKVRHDMDLAGVQVVQGEPDKLQHELDDPVAQLLSLGQLVHVRRPDGRVAEDDFVECVEGVEDLVTVVGQFHLPMGPGVVGRRLVRRSGRGGVLVVRGVVQDDAVGGAVELLESIARGRGGRTFHFDLQEQRNKFCWKRNHSEGFGRFQNAFLEKKFIHMQKNQFKVTEILLTDTKTMFKNKKNFLEDHFKIEQRTKFHNGILNQRCLGEIWNE